MKKTEPNRTYTASNGMVLKTKNAKNSWTGIDKEKPEILHETRRGQMWLECLNENHMAIAKHVDLVDAKAWLKENEHGL